MKLCDETSGKFISIISYAYAIYCIPQGVLHDELF